MAVEFQMPKLGLTMEEGTITTWLVEDGAEVEAGTAVLTIETDKVESDVEASHSGVLRITGEVGATYPCGEPIGWFVEPGEEVPEATGATARPAAGAQAPGSSSPTGAVQHDSGVHAGGGRPPAHGARLFASPNARRVAAERGIRIASVTGTGPGGRIVSEDVLRHEAAPPPAASAAARQVARRLGVDVAEVVPARPGGRVERADVERHVRDRLGGLDAVPAPPPQPPEAPLLQEPTRRIPLTGMRGTIAQRMHSSLSQMAQLTLTMDVEMDAVVADRGARGSGDRPGYTDYVVAAAAAALREMPVVNSQIADGAVNLLPEINVGLAVALDGGLVVPVVRETDRLDFDDLCAETRRLAAAARAGELGMEEIEGGTFSVTALGMYGVDAFTPVINPPNTAILGVGRLREETRWDDGVPRPARVLTLSLTWDHRAFDGAPAAEFTALVRDHLEGWGTHG